MDLSFIRSAAADLHESSSLDNFACRLFGSRTAAGCFAHVQRMLKFLNDNSKGVLGDILFTVRNTPPITLNTLYIQNALVKVSDAESVLRSGGSRKKYLGGLAPHHLGGNNG